MTDEYFNDLCSSKIGWDLLAQKYPPNKKLYKYQGFYTQEGIANPYWQSNMNGTFHMSLAREFEDINDCRPTIKIQSTKKIIEDFLRRFCNDQGKIKNIIDTFDSEIADEAIKKIESNYQSEIRIGCFTDSPNNLKMWDKYSDCGKGYCIEYDTSKHDLFKLSTLRVLYGCYINMTYHSHMPI